ncbi:putative glycosidase [Austwickia chelonae NBRC 105200]|uniref:Putative glycosidase n=1 Tax=Austwickia chelonae NBRC 105200 TaxID=1184607 RepID=K6V6L8_9MICO|nr:putative glycosidase [Austwickia chelonae NBRC 105200]
MEASAEGSVASVWAERADEAARSVVPMFGSRVWGVPGTHLGVVRRPRPPVGEWTWNYWWQAHYLDVLVDAGLRHGRAGDVAGARAYERLAGRLVDSIWLRNGGRFTNDFYDDMAWLWLAVGRLEAWRRESGWPSSWRSRRLVRVLSSRLVEGHTGDLGGGVFWTRRHDRKNVPASAPAAIGWARAGEVERARQVVEWIFATLFDERRGLALDTIWLDGRVDDTVYSYNQGVLLGALLAVGDERSSERAARVVEAVARHLCLPGSAVLRAFGDGDAGLFTGILVRYLAEAALSEALPGPVRARAAELVEGSAAAWWQGSVVVDGPRRARVFPVVPGSPILGVVSSPLEFSPQVQAWTILEAAASVAAGGGFSVDGPISGRWVR